MSFDLYFAGVRDIEADEAMMARGSCRLYSQLRDRSRGKLWLQQAKEKAGTKVFVDSGAYSAWSRGKSIDTDEYINYLNENTNELTLFASVDNIPGELTRTPTLKEKQQSPLLSWENYMYMRERVKEPDKLLPVFHMGEDFKHLSNMCNTILDGKHIPYIGLGGTVGVRPSSVKADWYKQCFKVIKESNNPNIKTHAFGMTSLDILENYPFTSADSTTWIMLAINGNILTKYGVVGLSNSAQHRPNHILKLPKDVQKQVESQIAECNLTLEECVENTNLRTVVNVHYIQNWADKYKYKGNNRFQKRLF